MYLFRQKSADIQLDSTIAAAMDHLLSTQQDYGAWSDCFDTGLMSDAQTLISLYFLGVVDPDWTSLLLRRIEGAQRHDGSWGVYPHDGGDLSTTVECYYALQLYNRWDGRSRWKTAAESFVRRHGSLKRCRNLTKVFLAIGGELPWSSLPSPRLYSWLFARRTPIHVWDIVTFTRLHISPMLYLSSIRYVSPNVQQPVLKNLSVAGPGSRRRIGVWHTNQRVNRGTNGHANPATFGKVQRARISRALELTLNDCEADGTVAGYHSATVLRLFTLSALGYSNHSPEIKRTVKSLRQNLYVFKDHTAHQQTCNAHVWNTALTLHALKKSGFSVNSLPFQKGLNFLLQHQHRKVGGWVLKSAVPPGGWAFSSNNCTHPDTDDTVSALTALNSVRDRHEEAWWNGVQWLLAMQNADGGWSAFEKDSNKQWIEKLPANDMTRAMTDPSTPDITGSVLAFLIQHRIVPRDDVIVQRGLKWLKAQQETDGSWFGRWGTTYIYGTWCAVKGLTAAEIPSSTTTMQFVKRWILSIQRRDGSFSESCESDAAGYYIPWHVGVPSQTAWGLETLLYLLEAEENATVRERLAQAAESAAHWLLQEAQDGRWEESMPTGSAFPGALHIQYEIYPKVWPLLALAHYRETLNPVKGGDRDVGPKIDGHFSGTYR